MGMQGLFFLPGPNRAGLWARVRTSYFLFANHSFSVPVYPRFVGPGGSELNLFEGGVGHPSVVKQWVLATGDAPLHCRYRDAVVAIGGKGKRKKSKGGGGGGGGCPDRTSGAPKWFLPLWLFCPSTNGAGVYHAVCSPTESRLSEPPFFSAGLNPPAAVNQSRAPVPSPFCQPLSAPQSAFQCTSSGKIEVAIQTLTFSLSHSFFPP